MKEAKELLFVVIEVPLVFKILWIILLSIVAYVAMFWDKLCAIKGWWRVSEANLLLWAFLGGAVGAKIGQRVFRHKTSKKPFKTYLNFALAANVLIFGVFSFFFRLFLGLIIAGHSFLAVAVVCFERISFDHDNARLTC